jgi:1,4-alpha-glucan branching enzyme
MKRTSQRGTLAVVLHAHLPWVLEEASLSPNSPISFEEAWLHEALWECYLPLAALLERVQSLREANPNVDGGERTPFLLLSLSPTLLAMLKSPVLDARFDLYVQGVRAQLAERRKAGAYLSAVAAHEARLESSYAYWQKNHRDLLAALLRLRDRGAIELGTTAATHGFLPGLLTAAGARAQIRIGLRYFREVTGRHASFFWLPECGYHPKLLPLLADSGASSTVLDTHALELGEPRPQHGALQPVFANEPFAFFGRHRELCSAVWSREVGYPGAAVYRDFHARPSEATPFELAFKPYAVTGQGVKVPYEAAVAEHHAARDAVDFLRKAALVLEASEAPRPIATVAFDAELFGHWWWEGPQFLAALLEAAVRKDSAVGLDTPTSYLATDPQLALSNPATSTWGRGGFSEVWSHPRVSHALRLVHRAERMMLQVDALVRDRPRTETQRRARLLAIRDLFLLQSSDLLFMLRTGQSQRFATARVQTLAARLDTLFEVALRERESASDGNAVAALEPQISLFAELEEDAFADTFDPF